MVSIAKERTICKRIALTVSKVVTGVGGLSSDKLEVMGSNPIQDRIFQVVRLSTT